MMEVEEGEEEEDPPKVHVVMEREPAEEREIKQSVWPIDGRRERDSRHRHPPETVNKGEEEEEELVNLLFVVSGEEKA
jgi:hypothetical protein